jgi:hypothetical protein
MLKAVTGRIKIINNINLAWPLFDCRSNLVAKNEAIYATSEAIIGLLKAASPFPSATFELYNSASFEKPGPSQGITLYLYRVSVSQVRRNLPPRLAADGTRYRPSVPVDLYYMLTPWASSAAQQQRLLGWAIRELEDNLVLPSGVLNRFVADEVFQPQESVALVNESLSLQDLANLLSDAAKLRAQLSTFYVARAINLDSDLKYDQNGQLVQTRQFDFEKYVPLQPGEIDLDKVEQ